MNYCITMEQTRRIAVFFEADTDEDAEAKAAQINRLTSSDDFVAGDDERDYAVCNSDTGQTILDWE
ncbi:hypothetical protein [uncultured Oscillibacter sp.]|uniref:hypothetical protein n=1 Tax=uncultured Oscillibacter sp. TaxID=876091 RepID=UPI00280A7F23|nr:hypothetical protein [uncultured Oscillibacter sp.]